MTRKIIPILTALALTVACDSKSSNHREGDSHDGHEDASDHGEHEEGGDHEGHGEEKGEHDEDGETMVRLSPAAMKKGAISIGKAGEGILKDALELPAEVQLPPDQKAHVSPLVDGQLLNVKVAIGDQVKAGQGLATLRSVALGRARAEYARTTALRDVAKSTLERQEKLREEGISSERSYLDAKAAYDQANAERSAALSGLSVFGASGGSGADMTLVSPIDGTLVERHATQGENVSPGDTLFVIADTSTVWVVGQAYERQLGRVLPEMDATISLPAFPSEVWKGKVSYVGATLSEGTRTLPVRVELDNKTGKLRPGLFGTLQLVPEENAKKGVLVPLTAVQELNGSSIVFVPEKEAGVFSTQPVTLGRENKFQVEILNGLTAGSDVVVDGGFILKSELVRGQLGHGHAH